MSLLKQYALSLSLAPSLIAAANTCQRQLTGGLYWAHNAESTCSPSCREAWEKELSRQLLVIWSQSES